MFCRIFSASTVATAAFTALGAASAFAATTTCSSVGACVLDVNTNSGPGIEGTSSTGEGVLGESFGTTSSTSAVNAGVRGIARTGYGLGLFGEGTFGAFGRGSRQAYGSRTTSPSIEHVGEAKLVAGTAFVSLDRGFASTIDASTPYLVFVTPEGDSRGLYVGERRAGGFVVRENGGGRSSTTFEYRIVARPLDAMQTQARAMRANSAAETATFQVHHPDIQNARPTDLSDHLPQ